MAAEHQWLLGFEWEDSFYKEACLPFGLATAPAIFNLFADAFEGILRTRLGWLTAVHYLDYFIRILAASQSHSTVQASIGYIQLTDALGIARNDSKDCCGTVVGVLGIEIDANLFMARLSLTKSCSRRSPEPRPHSPKAPF